jgi:hypothetical protein
MKFSESDGPIFVFTPAITAQVGGDRNMITVTMISLK